jgi:predicted transcriptional regulator
MYKHARCAEDYLKQKSCFNPAKIRKVTQIPNTLYTTLSVLGTNASKVSCVYLIKTEKYSNMCEDNENIYKYGYTCDLMRRMVEHEKKYGSDITLFLHAPVPNYFLRNAETDIKSFFDKGMWACTVPTTNELVKIENDRIGAIQELYRNVADKYNKTYEVLMVENALLHKVLKI